MKQLVAAFFVIVFASCSKENLETPSSVSKTSTPVSYSSGNIAINGFQAQVMQGEITVGFTTTFQKDVKTLEILRGLTPNNLCSIYKEDVSADSYKAIQYTTDDSQEATTQYYMVKYTLTDNDWGYTPVYILENNTAGH